MKSCTLCDAPFDPENFIPRKARPGKWYSHCRACRALKSSEHKKHNRQHYAQRMRDRRAADPEKAKADRRAHYERNKEKVLAQAARYRSANKEKELRDRKAHYERNKAHVAGVCSAYRKANKGKVTAWQKEYQTRKRKALPLWANLRKIAEIYATAAWLTASSGEPWHVDHIVPLQGKTVCGLHCETNLTLLPAGENLSKSNRWWPDMWDV